MSAAADTEAYEPGTTGRLDHRLNHGGPTTERRHTARSLEPKRFKSSIRSGVRKREARLFLTAATRERCFLIKAISTYLRVPPMNWAS